MLLGMAVRYIYVCEKVDRAGLSGWFYLLIVVVVGFFVIDTMHAEIIFFILRTFDSRLLLIVKDVIIY